jgi:hypothetical protein
MSFNYLQSIISGEVEDSQIASSLEKHKYMINLPPFDPDAYINEKKFK